MGLDSWIYVDYSIFVIIYNLKGHFVGKKVPLFTYNFSWQQFILLSWTD